MENKDIVTIRVRKPLHKQLKVLATQKGMWLEDLVESILFNYLNEKRKDKGN